MTRHERNFVNILMRWEWKLAMRAPASLGDVDIVAARPLDSGGSRVHVGEHGAQKGPKLSLTDNSRHKWKQVKTLKEAYAPFFEAYLWFRPKGVRALHGTEEHEKHFGFDVQDIQLDDSPLHYTEGAPMAEVLR